MKQFNKALKLRPNNVNALYYRGEVFLRLNNEGSSM